MVRTRTNVVIPCYNESSKIERVLKFVLELDFVDKVIVVDDFSSDKSVEIIEKYPVILLKNSQNKGAGYSIVRGLKHSYSLGNANFTITVDADGQHQKEDIETVYNSVKNIENKVLLIHAYRVQDKNTPIQKRISNILAYLAVLLIYQVNVRDPYCGLRMYHNSIIPEISFRNRFEWCADCAVLINSLKKHSLGVPVNAHYSDYSLSKGLNLSQGFRLFFRLLKSRFNTKSYEENISNNASLISSNWRN